NWPMHGRCRHANGTREGPMYYLRALVTITLLIASNIFMTTAWYGHLRYTATALWKVVLVSWGIALLEYCFQVPANRVGYVQFTAAQLKTMQEVITLVVFAVFSTAYLHENLRWNHFIGFT